MPATELPDSVPKARPIRSFVRREGRITASQQQALETCWPVWGIEFAGTVLDFNRVFGREAPVSLEIGFGNGDSMLHIAESQAHWNHLGIEVYRSGIGSLLKGIDERALDNVRIICADAVDVLEQMIADASISRMLLFFPDPWPKKRHHKRRLVQPGFAGTMARKLKPGGLLHMATDWRDYAGWMLDVMDSQPEFSNLAGPECYSEKPAYRPLTKFESRGKTLGHGVFDLLYRRN